VCELETSRMGAPYIYIYVYIYIYDISHLRVKEQPMAECNFKTVSLFDATEKCHRKPHSVEKVAGPQM